MPLCKAYRETPVPDMVSSLYIVTKERRHVSTANSLFEISYLSNLSLPISKRFYVIKVADKVGSSSSHALMLKEPVKMVLAINDVVTGFFKEKGG
ncbi:hypothetical protein CCR75_006307 [Bremia lactucae]|uniref:Uncharacterized protein n=1 Tax=Bremia lactucae TaxID=4779 RepID=A0A976FNV1_BRELC|nr:hypothetical protein CCR75_006307 [Bremia lactucae]